MTENDAIVKTTLRDLWPGASVADADRGGAGPVRARYAVLPSRSNPRLLVPVDVVTSRSGSRQRGRWADEEVRGTSEWIRAAADRITRSWRHQDRIEVRGGGDGLDIRLSELLGRAVTFSIWPRSGHWDGLTVLHVHDATGGTVARVKIAATPHTVEALRSEGQALDALARRDLRLVASPRVLGSLTWQGRPVLVLEALPEVPWKPGNKRRPPEDAMDELAQAFPTGPAPLEGSVWWQRQWDLTARLDRLTRSRLGRCLERTAYQAAGQDLAWGGWHGDWTPWTMAHREGRVFLWDWAHFEAEAPLGLERLHYLASRTMSQYENDPDLLLSALRSADADTMSPGTTAHLRGLLYLVALATRYADAPQTQGPSDRASRSEVVLVALEKLSGEVREID